MMTIPPYAATIVVSSRLDVDVVDDAVLFELDVVVALEELEAVEELLSITGTPP